MHRQLPVQLCLSLGSIKGGQGHRQFHYCIASGVTAGSILLPFSQSFWLVQLYIILIIIFSSTVVLERGFACYGYFLSFLFTRQENGNTFFKRSNQALYHWEKSFRSVVKNYDPLMVATYTGNLLLSRNFFHCVMIFQLHVAVQKGCGEVWLSKL